MGVNEKTKLKIVCVGIGNAGGNVIANMAMSEVNLIAINTDLESSVQVDGVTNILISPKLIGSWINQQLRKELLKKPYYEIKNALQGADIIFILAGLGGDTGTSATPIITKIAKEMGTLTIPIVTMPFNFEGKKRKRAAEGSLNKIKQVSDSTVVFYNNNLLPFIDNTLGLRDAFKVIDLIIKDTINSIIGIVVQQGECDINLDFYDLETIMNHKGVAFIGIGEGKGIDSANEAVTQSIEHALLVKDVALSKANGILIHFNVHTDFPITKIVEAMDIIYESASDDAEIIFGTTTDKSLNDKYVKATMILTGLEENDNIANNVHYKQL